MNARIIVIRILGEAEGFLESPWTDAYPTSAITIEGPNVLISITNMSVKLFIVCNPAWSWGLTPFYYDKIKRLFPLNPANPSLRGKTLLSLPFSVAFIFTMPFRSL